MLYRNIFLFVLFFVFVPFNSFAATCYFDVDSINCSRFVSSFNEFDLSFDPSLNMQSFDVELYNKDNSNNKVLLEVDSNKVKQINPFLESGVYVLDVKAYNRGGDVFEKTFDFVFDNLEPAAPLVDMNLFSNLSSIVVGGSVDFSGLRVYAKVGSSSPVVTTSDSNGDFSLTLDLVDGINYVKFYSENLNGVKSAIVERVVVSGEKIVNKKSDVSLSSIDDLSVLNERTVKSSGAYFTSKRNFYVSGTASGVKGGEVYVNGVRVKFDSVHFGGFILLNEGENLVEVRSGGDVLSEIVNLVQFDFKFESFDYDRIVSTDSMNFAGEVNYNLPFYVYVNGDFSQRVVPVNGEFDVTLGDLKQGKNFIYVEGLSGEYFSTIVYQDFEEPQVEVITSSDVKRANKFIFKAKDDTGFGLDFLQMSVGNLDFGYDSVEMRGDYYLADISSLPSGTYSYEIKVVDRVLKEKVVSGQISIGSDVTAIESFDFERGSSIGNFIYVPSGSQRVILHPSEHIVFDHIYLDGVDVIDYTIRANGDVEVNIDFKEEGGVLQFNYLNSQREVFSEDYTYFSDDDKPVLKLDYIEKSSSYSLQAVRISGEIDDDYFDWGSLSFNSDSNFQRFGSYFEGYVDISNGELNLEVYGSDMSENAFDIENRIFGGVLFGDSSLTRVDVTFGNSNFFEGSLISSDPFRNRNFVYSYDGIDSGLVFLKRGAFLLPIHEREGVRSLNMRGVESSGLEFGEFSLFSVDNTAPRIAFDENEVGFLRIIIDGTYSELDEDSLVILVNSSEVSISDCDSSYPDLGVYQICREVAGSLGDLVNVSVRDVYSNFASSSYIMSYYITTPGNPYDPEDPGNTDPYNPNNPENPYNPQNPENPVVPGEPLPENYPPNDPNDPNNPENPENPSNRVCDPLTQLGVDVPLVYFGGNNEYTLDEKFVLQGSVLYDGNLDFVKANGKDCVFDSSSFACEFNLDFGLNSFEIVASDIEGCSNTAEFNVTYREAYDIDVEILRLIGDGLLKIGDVYYLISGDISVEGVVSNRSIISVVIGDDAGFRSLVGSREGSFIVDADVTSQVAGKSQDEFFVWLEAEDERGGRGISEKVKIMFSNVIEAIINIVVG